MYITTNFIACMFFRPVFDPFRNDGWTSLLRLGRNLSSSGTKHAFKAIICISNPLWNSRASTFILVWLMEEISWWRSAVYKRAAYVGCDSVCWFYSTSTFVYILLYIIDSMLLRRLKTDNLITSTISRCAGNSGSLYCLRSDLLAVTPAINSIYNDELLQIWFSAGVGAHWGCVPCTMYSSRCTDHCIQWPRNRLTIQNGDDEYV